MVASLPLHSFSFQKRSRNASLMFAGAAEKEGEDRKIAGVRKNYSEKDRKKKKKKKGKGRRMKCQEDAGQGDSEWRWCRGGVDISASAGRRKGGRRQGE